MGVRVTIGWSAPWTVSVRVRVTVFVLLAVALRVGLTVRCGGSSTVATGGTGLPGSVILIAVSVTDGCGRAVFVCVGARVSVSVSVAVAGSGVVVADCVTQGNSSDCSGKIASALSVPVTVGVAGAHGSMVAVGVDVTVLVAFFDCGFLAAGPNTRTARASRDCSRSSGVCRRGLLPIASARSGPKTNVQIIRRCINRRQKGCIATPR